MLSKHYLIAGRVQGVGFRHFVRQQAQALGIVGVVRNLADGRVEILAKGPAPAIVRLTAAVGQGPQYGMVGSTVTDLQVNDVDFADVLPDTNEFAVVADGEAPWSFMS